jgi:hypothetical protein
MKNNFWFRPTLGDEIYGSSIETIKKIIFENDADYWSMKEGKGGESAIKIEGSKIDPLIFFYDEPYGFFLYYDVQFVPIQKGIPLKDDIVVEHLVGGEPMRVPSICYRTREEAWEIVLDFINEQKMNEKYNWVPLADIEYDIGPYG